MKKHKKTHRQNDGQWSSGVTKLKGRQNARSKKIAVHIALTTSKKPIRRVPKNVLKDLQPFEERKENY